MILSVFLCMPSRVIYMLFKEMHHNYLKISCTKIFYAYSALLSMNPSLMPSSFSGRILSFFFPLKNCIPFQRSRRDSITITHNHFWQPISPKRHLEVFYESTWNSLYDPRDLEVYKSWFNNCARSPISWILC